MTNFAKVNFDTKAQIDQVLGSYSGSFSAPGSGATTTFPIPNGLGAQTLFYGQFNVDGGTYYALDGTVIIGGSEKLFVSVYADTNNNLVMWAINTDTVAHTIGYKLVAISARGNGAITPQPTSQKLLLSSSYNYPKIALIGSLSASVSTSSVQLTVQHNLGVIPYAHFWVGMSGNIYNPASTTFNPTSNLTTEIQVDTSNVNAWFALVSGSSTVTLYYRLYYDN